MMYPLKTSLEKPLQSTVELQIGHFCEFLLQPLLEVKMV